MTAHDLMTRAAIRLRKAGIEQPALEAELLLAHVLHIPRERLIAHPETVIAKSDGRQYLQSVGRRARHVPYAQIVGERWFYGRSFIVTPDVLIPRPATETLVEAVLSHVIPSKDGILPGQDSGFRRNDKVMILDIGTGSGAIGLTLAAQFPDAKAVLYDVSAKALAVARRNARRLKLARRVRLARLDILRQPLPEPRGLVIVAANLPYLPTAVWRKAMPEVRLHEPKLALVSGKDGLDHYRALFKKLTLWKRPPAVLALEAEPRQFKELRRLAQALMPAARIEVLKDIHRDDRVLIAAE